MKRDIDYQIPTYKNWIREVKSTGIEGINKANSDLIIQYISDMETGQNVARRSKKGARSYRRLNVSKNKLIQIAKLFEKRGIKDLSKITEKQVHLFTDDLYKGKITRQDGKPYEYPVDFIRMFKAFFHWYMKVSRKKGKIIPDICEDLELRTPKSKFVYFTKEQLDKMLPYFNYEEQILCKFLFDTGIRFPTECLSLKVKDIYEKEGEVWTNIPDEVSKTFGRQLNLIYCGEALLEYIKKKELNPDDFLFYIKDNNGVLLFNRKLKQVAKQVLGDKISHPKAQGKFSEISGYDFRHSSAIHLRVLASKNNSISLDSLRHRLGHKDFSMLDFYTAFIGLQGEIKKESLLIQEDRSRFERELEKAKRDILNLRKMLRETQK